MIVTIRHFSHWLCRTFQLNLGYPLSSYGEGSRVNEAALVGSITFNPERFGSPSCGLTAAPFCRCDEPDKASFFSIGSVALAADWGLNSPSLGVSFERPAAAQPVDETS